VRTSMGFVSFLIVHNSDMLCFELYIALIGMELALMKWESFGIGEFLPSYMIRGNGFVHGRIGAG
jgi:hypothetical protein